ncbi:MAG TPA: ATP-NAD kinase family protein [Pseudomonadales bacterium]
MKTPVWQRRLRLGLIINPYAGIGGAAALKGSDEDSIRDRALAYSGELRSPGRSRRFLVALGDAAGQADWYCGGGLMGEAMLGEQGIRTLHVLPVASPSSADDTRQLAGAMLAQGVDLLLFVGGDGTARDIVDVVADRLPCLGIPSGVKMQSAVFALSPEAAAEVVRTVLDGSHWTVSAQDVRDIDEAALRQGRVRSRYYGSMQVPAMAQWLQRLKQGGVESESLVLDDIAAHLTEIMQDSGRLMLAGPGSTIAHWMASLGLPNTLVGFDAVVDGRLLQADLTGHDIEALLQQYPDLLVVISPTGQQGFLLGRGNQQLTPAVIAALDKSQWLLVATRSKLNALNGQPLLVDSNDSTLDRSLCGLYPVIVAWHQQLLYPVNLVYGNPDDV